MRTPDLSDIVEAKELAGGKGTVFAFLDAITCIPFNFHHCFDISSVSHVLICLTALLNLFLEPSCMKSGLREGKHQQKTKNGHIKAV